MISKECESTLSGLLMKMTHQYFTSSFGEMKKLGIHPGQIPMLHLLQKEDGLTQKEIARKLHIRPPTVTVTLQRLEKNGLVCRRDDEKDRRIIRISLTDQGRLLAGQIQGIVEKYEKQMFRGFTESEQCLLRGFFLQMLQNLTESTEKKERTHD